jgi:hypothetical protein
MIVIVAMLFNLNVVIYDSSEWRLLVKPVLSFFHACLF